MLPLNPLKVFSLVLEAAIIANYNHIPIGLRTHDPVLEAIESGLKIDLVIWRPVAAALAYLNCPAVNVLEYIDVSLQEDVLQARHASYEVESDQLCHDTMPTTEGVPPMLSEDMTSDPSWAKLLPEEISAGVHIDTTNLRRST